jgi:hypothetical protein
MASAPTPYPNVNRPRRRAWIAVSLLLLFFLSVGTFALFAALYADGPLTPRILLALMAALGLGLPIWALAVSLRRRLRTGHWLIDAEERRRNATRFLAREASPVHRRFQQSLWIVLSVFWLSLAAVWIRRSLHHPQKLPWTFFWIAICALNLWSTLRSLRKPASVCRTS